MGEGSGFFVGARWGSVDSGAFAGVCGGTEVGEGAGGCCDELDCVGVGAEGDGEVCAGSGNGEMGGTVRLGGCCEPG